MDYIFNKIDGYLKSKGTAAGLNAFLSKDETIKLFEHYNVSTYKEAIYLHTGNTKCKCKICDKYTKFISKKLGYNIYCSDDCKRNDTDANKIKGQKGAITRKENGYIVLKNKSNCKYCNAIIFIRPNSHHKGFCDNHKKECPMCQQRHNKAGKCCSKECYNNMKKNTFLSKYGVENNLLFKGIRRNDISYYLNKGLTPEEASIKLSEYQKSIYGNSDVILSRMYSSLGVKDYDEYISYIVDKIILYPLRIYYKPYTLIRKFTSDTILNIHSIKSIYNKMTKINSNIFNYDIKKIIKQKYSFHHYVDEGLLRSNKEMEFYLLLKANNINFILSQLYPNSKMRCDFYLTKYNLNVEIAGMMNMKSYREKIEYKYNTFDNVIILETTLDMLNFIQKLKNMDDENKENN